MLPSIQRKRKKLNMISQHLAKQDISDDVTFLNNVIPSGFKDSKTRSVRSRL